ncbi:hypothetical protein MMC32_005092 [Xylographa parallela]|nr:hypothetical protein [Xylographa parallela]
MEMTKLSGHSALAYYGGPTNKYVGENGIDPAILAGTAQSGRANLWPEKDELDGAEESPGTSVVPSIATIDVHAQICVAEHNDHPHPCIRSYFNTNRDQNFVHEQFIIVETTAVHFLANIRIHAKYWFLDNSSANTAVSILISSDPRLHLLDGGDMTSEDTAAAEILNALVYNSLAELGEDNENVELNVLLENADDAKNTNILALPDENSWKRYTKSISFEALA